MFNFAFFGLLSLSFILPMSKKIQQTCVRLISNAEPDSTGCGSFLASRPNPSRGIEQGTERTTSRRTRQPYTRPRSTNKLASRNTCFYASIRQVMAQILSFEPSKSLHECSSETTLTALKRRRRPQLDREREYTMRQPISARPSSRPPPPS